MRSYQIDVLGSMPMRFSVLLSLMLLASATVFAHEAKVTAEGMSEEFATVAAMRQVPEGATVIARSCTSQDVAMSTRYFCTVKYSD